MTFDVQEELNDVFTFDSPNPSRQRLGVLKISELTFKYPQLRLVEILSSLRCAV